MDWRHISAQAWPFVAVALGLLGLLVILLWLNAPIGPATLVEGRIRDFRFHESEQGSDLRMMVQVSGGQSLVRMPRGMVCKVGDRVQLYERRTNGGRRHSLVLGSVCSR